ncbi:hypothetical protein ACFW6E_34645 [Streptomyces olivaceoviridis]|uniref:D-alanine--D-alanine ligase family protein n=1 Tax=Streptomyces olivaceoviridis TaxID=1921 RepID=UPI0036A6CA17
MQVKLINPLDYQEGLALITGGWSAERHRALLSGQAVLGAMNGMGLSPRLIDLQGGTDSLLKQLDGVHTAFLAIAGRGAEDGRLQGFLETLGINYTGSGVMASAVAMHKPHAKAVVAAAGIPTPAGTVIHTDAPVQAEASRLEGLLGPDVVIKPVNEGCSVGLRIASGLPQIAEVLTETEGGALMAEVYHRGRSISVGVLAWEADGMLTTLPPLEAQTPDGVYTHEAKQNGAVYHCPTALTYGIEEVLCETAMAAHVALGLHSYSRHDFVVTAEDEVFWLEANTLPGLSHQGNLAQMAHAAGLSYEQLISHILRGARTDRRAQP